MDKKQAILTNLPKVDKLLQHEKIVKLTNSFPRNLLVRAIRKEMDDIRNEIISSSQEQILLYDRESIIKRIFTNIEIALKPRLRRCINATGIILHTGLGRAPLSQKAREAIMEVTNGFSSVEIELETGKRGNRHNLVEEYLVELTNAEAAAVVNNNAAATFLTLNSLAATKECIISRGELITIGGSFRIPDIMKKSGSMMVEIGTTNQTWLQDYEQAITENTALLLKIHTSNYRISGFVSEVTLAELVQLGQKHQVPVMHDLGSGSLIDLSRYGLPREPIVKESIDIGADIVTFSGDKLLGGPQAGIIVGKKKYVDLIKKNQLTRTMRCGKLTFAGLEATLRLFFDDQKLITEHETLKLLTNSIDNILSNANKLEKELRKVIGTDAVIGIEPGKSEIGGGSLATESLPTYLVFLKINGITEEELAKRLRFNDPPIIARIHNDRVIFDVRTIIDHELDFITQAVSKIFTQSRSLG